MSTAELLTVVFGLLLGYGIISRWMGQRRSNAGDAGNGEGPGDPRREWIRAHCHEILGVSPDAPFEAIYSAYRNLPPKQIAPASRRSKWNMPAREGRLPSLAKRGGRAAARRRLYKPARAGVGSM